MLRLAFQKQDIVDDIMTWEEQLKIEKSPLDWQYTEEQMAINVAFLMAAVAMGEIQHRLGDEDFRNGMKSVFKKLLTSVAEAPKNIRDKIYEKLKRKSE